MTTRQRATALLLALAVLVLCLMACIEDDWDGMDRDEWHRGPTATFESRQDWPPPPQD